MLPRESEMSSGSALTAHLALSAQLHPKHALTQYIGSETIFANVITNS